MTPVQFENLYRDDWDELDRLLGAVRGVRKEKEPIPGERVAALYRRTCEHLALSRARAYPAYLVDRLEQLTSEAHQAIYQQRDFGLRRLYALVAVDFPQAVRRHSNYVWLATAVFVLPTLILGLLVYLRPELILSVVDAQSAAEFERMYSGNEEAIGRLRDANTDWAMFGYYIRHNIGLAFQCFASGLLAGLGSLFFLAYNGAFFGALAGYLTQRGFGETFYSFVVTHAAFELTAIVLAGAAGLRIGHSLLAPGRLTRRQALVAASRESVVIIYGVTALLLIAAAVEAFWSSARWIPPLMKYGVAAICWISVLAYLTLQGRRAG
ncbi:stage II sporulation protein M [Steroidobacter sp.]|uniref:stage II sporulation protein M n=1 Tax=Steroidobacter sp. TaxID=1978227 RepID=UPI001A45D1B2|nr:stage II sporulation protein M [Steroidobacter sp.]MBL8266125.1 stage II sporulation protein M [Steroidobacter sp.]